MENKYLYIKLKLYLKEKSIYKFNKSDIYKIIKNFKMHNHKFIYYWIKKYYWNIYTEFYILNKLKEKINFIYLSSELMDLKGIDVYGKYENKNIYIQIKNKNIKNKEKFIIDNEDINILIIMIKNKKQIFISNEKYKKHFLYLIN